MESSWEMGNGYIIETNCYSLGHAGLFCGTSLSFQEKNIIQGKTVMYRYSKSPPGHLVLCCILAAGRHLLGVFWITREREVWHKIGCCWFLPLKYFAFTVVPSVSWVILWSAAVIRAQVWMVVTVTRSVLCPRVFSKLKALHSQCRFSAGTCLTLTRRTRASWLHLNSNCTRNV